MDIFGLFNTSLAKALSDIDKNWKKLDGLIICGVWPGDYKLDNEDELIEKIRQARESGRPYLGICYGHQLACREYARNVLKIDDSKVLEKMPELKVGVHDGESYWHRYKTNIIWRAPDNFITTQFHPEYQSYPDKPHPILLKFIKLCENNGIVDGLRP
jgi:CTP synthase (UTP-ammonia lyase)